MRRLTGLVLFVVLLTIGWGAWWWYAQQSFATELAHWEQRGFALSIDELSARHGLDSATVPGSRWDLLLQAEAAINPTLQSPRSSNEEFPGYYPPADPLWQQMAGAAVEANGPTLALVENAMAGKPRTYVDPLSLTLNNLGVSSQARHLSGLLADVADYHLSHGRTAEGLRALEQLHALVAEMRGGWTLNNYYTVIGIDMQLTSAVRQNASTLAVGSDDLDASAIRRLVEALLDDAAWESAEARTIAAEVASLSDMFDQVTPHRWATGPTATLDYARMLRTIGEREQAMAATTHAQALSFVSAEPYFSCTPPPPDLQTAAPISEWYATGDGWLLSITHHNRFERQVAAIALAVALYRNDHAGTVPATLDALVPDYLPAVPTDTFRPDNGPMGYMVLAWPDGLARPIVFTVGENHEADFSERLRKAGDIAVLAETLPMNFPIHQPMDGWESFGQNEDDRLIDLSHPTPTFPRLGQWVDPATKKKPVEPYGWYLDPQTNEEYPLIGPDEHDPTDDWGGYDNFGEFGGF